LLEGENPADYNELFARVSAAVKPADIFEEMWVSEIVNLAWDISRWHRLKVQLINASTEEGVRAILKRAEPVRPLLAPIEQDLQSASSLSKKWAAGCPDAVKKLEEALASGNLSMDAVMAHTLAAKIIEIERIDRLAMNAEMRRNAALREIERHRGTFGKALRSATDEVVDAEFEPVEAPQIDNKKAA
jgi:hypothetical protein